MNLPMSAALVLAAVALLAMLRIGRARPLLLAMQPLLAAALWLALFPPTVERPGETLVLLTAHARMQDLPAQRDEGVIVSLPDAPRPEGAIAMPDLATALRRWPHAARLRVLGDGLRPRDAEAVGTRALEFLPSAPRTGIDAVHAASTALAGQSWRVQGHVQAAPGARIELLDPASAVVARAPLAPNGNFELTTSPPAAGRVDYVLRLRGADGKPIESVSLPVAIEAGRRPRLWLLAGGPDPEQKYLRRWAEDAGWQVRARASLGAGVQVGDAISLDPAALAQVDLLVLDLRSLRGLSPGARAQLRRAVGEGLGLLLRLHDATPADRALLREFGFDATPVAMSQVRLAGARAPFEHEEVTTLARAPLQAAADDAVVLLRDAAGAPLARWRALGRGRVAAWGLGDGYRLVLSGQPALYGALWSGAAGALARAHGEPGPRLQPSPARAQQRAVICGLNTGATVVDATGRPLPLRVDERGCAAWWPARAGWHRLDTRSGSAWWPVIGDTDWPQVRARADREATLALRARAQASRAESQRVPGPRLPWFLAWLLASALAWWLERRSRVTAGPATDAG